MADTAAPTARLGHAIALILLANLLFAFVDTSTKWLSGAGLAVLQLAFMRYAVHLAITGVDIGRVPCASLPWRTHALVGFRAFCLISATVVNFHALGQLPLSVTAAILYLAPVITCLLGWLILGERIGIGHLGAIIFGFAGVLIIVRPFDDDVNLYALLMLYPATAMSLYAVLTRMLTGQVRPGLMQFYTGVLGTAVLAPAGYIFWENPETTLGWILLFAIGAFAWAGHEALTRAHAYAGASTLMPFGYSFVIYLSLAGWIVFGNVPDLATIIGAFVICAAGLIIWRLRG
ncbi:MAG: DMT family transporter [Rhodobacteraceae bacterium]|nr:DMT family transporter [Paracoccaceae bacterium]